MRRPLIVLLLLAASVGRAEPTPEVDADACAPCEAERARLQGAVDALQERERASASKIERLGADLDAQAQRVATLQQALEDTERRLDGACRSTDALVDAFVLGQPIPDGAARCVAPEHARALGTFQTGLAGALAVTDALRDYADGATDRVPRAPHPTTPVEAAVGRLVEPVAVYRRLLVEAVTLVAPRFWGELRGRSWREAAAWLHGSDPLDPALLDEVHNSTLGDEDGAETAARLTTGLQLTRAFVAVAGCAPSDAPSGCARARQVEELLETSRPLLAERRSEAIWATDCGALEPSVVEGWFADLPGGRRQTEGWRAIEDAAYARLFGCFLGARDAGASFPAWLALRLPAATEVKGPVFGHLQAVRGRFVRGGDEDRCARAVRVLQALPDVTTCALSSERAEPLLAWHPSEDAAEGLSLETCTRMAESLWRGEGAEIPTSFGHSPARADLVRPTEGEGGAARLRALCDDRRGGLDRFPIALARLARIAEAWGDDPALPPWRTVGGSEAPLEQQAYVEAASLLGWARAIVTSTSACEAVGISDERCARCLGDGGQGRYDCELRDGLAARWSAWTRRAAALALSLCLGAVGLVWGRELVRVRASHGRWLDEARAALSRAGLEAGPRPLRLLFPRRYRTLVLTLPQTPDWERWGRRAVIVRAERGGLAARDVDEAASLARQIGSELALVVHDEHVSPELGAVRAMLDWAVRGAQAVQVLPATRARLEWVRSPSDLLDLVEQTSLRGNPFEVRGRITSASQFFNRERIVSGLLASIQTGTWTLVTGLRRMGKSSLALEVARQLNGPSAYVDFAGFHHEIARAPIDVAASAILRDMCLRLAGSASERFGVTIAPPPEGDLDSSRLAAWFQELGVASLGRAGRRGGHAIVIFDEIEQAIGASPGRVVRSLEVLATVLGRLRAALDTPGAGGQVGVLLCGAIHPFLWLPMAPLAGGTLMSSLPRVVVPRLDDDAAAAMMRGLGARQGIRFSEEALELIIREAQGIPLLVRRLGSSVLELFDPERARQGSLGAVNVGREGALAAVQREHDEGAPLRVWVESEIADPHSPAGEVLRELSRSGEATADRLREVARDETLRQLRAGGAAELLDEAELSRRADEAASATLLLLTETGLVSAEGELTRPTRYRLPDGLLRRILASAGARGPFDLR